MVFSYNRKQAIDQMVIELENMILQDDEYRRNFLYDFINLHWKPTNEELQDELNEMVDPDDEVQLTR